MRSQEEVHLQINAQVRRVGDGPLTVPVSQLEEPRVGRLVVLVVHHHCVQGNFLHTHFFLDLRVSHNLE